MRAILAVAVLTLLAGCIAPAPPAYDAHTDPTPATTPAPSPYSGQETRLIKALSAEDIAGYQTGAGLGYAKPAELNSYPGPLHALDMASRLALSAEQHEALTAFRADMLAQAVPLGERYLQVEGMIERSFRDGTLDEQGLRALLEESADIEAKLRFVHLRAHLATRDILTSHQVALYDEARGYGKADHAAHAHT